MTLDPRSPQKPDRFKVRHRRRPGILIPPDAVDAVCTRCGTTKPIDEFYRSGGPAYRTAYCKPCTIAASSERLKTPRGWAVQAMAGIRYRCARDGGTTDLTVETLVQMLEATEYRCPVFGTPMSPALSSDDKPSVDRVDSTRGYDQGNVVVISWRANRKKGNTTATELLLLAKWLMIEGRRRGMSAPAATPVKKTNLGQPCWDQTSLRGALESLGGDGFDPTRTNFSAEDLAAFAASLTLSDRGPAGQTPA